METKKWEELAKERFLEAKTRLMKSEGRLAYMKPEDMSLIHEKMRASLSDIEAKIVEIGGYASQTKRIFFLRAEVQLAEAEVQLAIAELKLLSEMIELDMSMSRKNKAISRFLAEEAVRLAEAEVRLVEAELRDDAEVLAWIEFDFFLPGEVAEVEKFFYDTEEWLRSDSLFRSRLSEEEAYKVAYDQQYYEMEALAKDLYTKAEMDFSAETVRLEIRIAKLKVRLAEKELQLAEAELVLVEIENSGN